MLSSQPDQSNSWALPLFMCLIGASLGLMLCSVLRAAAALCHACGAPSVMRRRRRRRAQSANNGTLLPVLAPANGPGAQPSAGGTAFTLEDFILHGRAASRAPARAASITPTGRHVDADTAPKATHARGVSSGSCRLRGPEIDGQGFSPPSSTSPAPAIANGLDDKVDPSLWYSGADPFTSITPSRASSESEDIAGKFTHTI
ncbi:hypothetical protein AURDEDRAFT_175900 [Auricularia subglabra TFB-10046 SS5]|uniref:Uncharacterized protein n=1 Tax=Auricularia subglabra (strain TFB-10046 / SS5) TaxID=717982 RepID=J0CWK4_AURST|nr:hypothetical protein AURDEDRAFT_175900 [Auricularia subglabra TFB-10046 SS5]